MNQLQDKAENFVEDFVKNESKKDKGRMMLIILGFVFTFAVIAYAATWAQDSVNKHIDCVVNAFTVRNPQDFKAQLSKCKD